jgi:hypothetical protein
MTAERFMNLFAGMKEAHGCYILKGETPVPGKKNKGTGITKRSPLTLGLWEKHLSGDSMLGVIPIRSDNTCLWGAIDIDIYDMDLKVFSQRCYKQKIPLIPMRTKSGGCHLVIFLKGPVSARSLQDKLYEIAASLGFGQSEIFPKQSTVLVEKGDTGNWLNMPYFGGARSSRYALDATGEAMSMDDFLDAAEKLRVSPGDMESTVIEEVPTELADGPPCLQALIAQGFPDGTRNNGLFSLGVYCRKAFPDTWAEKLQEYNLKYMDPPLEKSEVSIVAKQVDKKEYNYKCRDQPIKSFCNAALCRTRAHGIGSGSMPSMTSLRKIPTDEPVWFLDINGESIELTTEQLQIQPKFQKMCMEELNIMPPRQTEKAWQSIIQALLSKCEPLDKPPETGVGDQFVGLVEAFCSDARMLATKREDLLLGRAWAGAHPDDEVDEVQVYFRLKDLVKFLIRNQFRSYTLSQITSRLERLMGAKRHKFHLKKTTVNVWYIAEPEGQTEPFEIPEMKGDVL